MNSNIFRQAVRRYASAAKLPKHALEPAFGPPNKEAAKAFRESLAATEKHAEGTSRLWAKISFLVAAPAIILTAINTYFVEMEHYEHRKHLEHVPDKDWPRDYEFMNVRSKPFFWGDGDKTAFWNPVVNRHIPRDD